MTVEKRLRSDMLKHPLFLSSRLHAYYEWFAVPNNGLYWEKGELIGELRNPFRVPIVCTKDPLNMSVRGAVEKAFRRYTDRRHLLNYSISETMNHLERSIKEIINVENKMLDFTPKHKYSYLWEKSPICNIPNDVKPQWRKACFEFYSFLLEHKEYMAETTDSEKWLRFVGLTLENKKEERNSLLVKCGLENSIKEIELPF